MSPTESPVLWYGGRIDFWVLRFIVNIMDSKSRHRIFFYPIKEMVKRTGKTFETFLSSGGRLWKGKVLAPFSSVVIYGLLISSSLLKMLGECVSLKMPKFGNFVMILVSVENAYKVFILKIFQKSVCVKNVF